MRVVKIVSGVVDLISDLQEGQDIPIGWIELPQGSLVGPGWLYDGEEFSPPQSHLSTNLGPHRVTRIEFVRLFSGVQQVKINALRKMVAGLSVEDYSDPASGLIVQLELVFQNFDLPEEFIELDHPDLALALGLLDYAGVFGTDGTTEIPRIIAGNPPE